MSNEGSNVATKASRRSSLLWGGALMLVLIVWAGAFAMRHGGEPVELQGWSQDFSEAQSQAVQADAPMLVLFTADWCGPCQSFKREVLTKPDAQAAVGEGFVPVKVDLTSGDPGSENIAVAERYGVRGIPTLLALNPDGEPISAFNGERSVSGLMDWLANLDR